MADTSNPITTALNILRRLPPKDVEQDVVRVSCLLDPELEDELYQRVDLPLKTETDADSGKDYIVCDYNRDGDSHRSPWSNKYFPEIPDGMFPAGELRELELSANSIFDVYRQQYFGTGSVSSVYMWDLGNNNFAGAFLITKDVQADGFNGAWNSIHVVEASRLTDEQYNYRTTSTVLISIQSADNPKIGSVNLSGSSQHTAEVTKPFNSGDPKQSHIGAIGPLIEQVEKTLMNNVEGVYFSKTNEVQNGMRIVDSGIRKAQNQMANAFMAAQAKKNKAQSQA